MQEQVEQERAETQLQLWSLPERRRRVIVRFKPKRAGAEIGKVTVTVDGQRYRSWGGLSLANLDTAVGAVLRGEDPAAEIVKETAREGWWKTCNITLACTTQAVEMVVSHLQRLWSQPREAATPTLL